MAIDRRILEPCYGCQKRTENCHSTCKKHAVAIALHKVRKAKEMEARGIASNQRGYEAEKHERLQKYLR